jgi:hypothetical protein
MYRGDMVSPLLVTPVGRADRGRGEGSRQGRGDSQNAMGRDETGREMSSRHRRFHVTFLEYMRRPKRFQVLTKSCVGAVEVGGFGL